MIPINLLANPSFGGGWTDCLPYGGRLTNQCPADYNLYIRLPGDRLISADSYDGPDDAPVYDTVAVVPECVHKLRSQLPDADELILEGDVVYKIFSATNPFSIDLIAQVLITEPGMLRVIVPVQVHNHGDGSPGAAVWRLIVNDDYGPWLTFGNGFVDRVWRSWSNEMHVMPGQVITAIAQMESRALGGIDFFTDAWCFDFTPDAEPQPEPEPEPEEPVNYVVVVNLLPQDATKAEKAYVLDLVHASRETILQSADDAARLVAPGADGSFVRVWDGHRWPGDIPIQNWLVVHGVGFVEMVTLPGSDPDPEPPDPEPEPPIEPPDPSWKPHNFVPYGTKLGWHAIGNCGLANMPKPPDNEHPEPWIDYGIYGSDMISPTIKLVRAISDIQYMPCAYPMVRLVDATVDGVPVNYQNFDYNGNPEAQAEARVVDLVRALSPYAGQFRWTELCNEQDIPDLEHAAMIARYWKRAMEVAPSWLGFLHASFGTGNPELEYWKPIADTGVFEMMAARGDGLAFHSYHDHRVPSDLVWHLTRYRFLYDEYILPRQLDIPMVLTECGPWRHLFYDSTFNVAEWVIVTDTWLAQDPYAMGQIYTVTDVGGETEYNDAFKALYPWFIDYAKSMKDRANG